MKTVGLKKVVRLENGMFRYSVKCTRCKKHWTEEAKDCLQLGSTHRCEKINSYIERISENKFMNMFWPEKGPRLIASWIKYEILTHTLRDDGGHVCDDRCMSATGHSCECSCGGKNHGAHSVIA